ncbi:hypothetical protein DJ527_12265, partial [Sulfolobus sp. F1]
SLVIAGVNKKYNLIGYGLGLNAFWLIPYLVFYHGLPSVSPLYLLVGLLFLSLGLLLYYLEYKRKDILYVSLISLILLVIGFNVTPLLFLYLILLIGSLKSIKTLLNASLIVLIAISLISFSYGLSLRYQNVTYYTLDLQMPKTGIYGFGAQTDNLTKLLTSGIAYNAVNYSTKYFLYDGKIIYNPLYFGYPFAPIPNYSSIIRFSYAYTNSGEIFFIYSPFNQLLGILWYPLSNDSELTLTFPFSVKSLQGVIGVIAESRKINYRKFMIYFSFIPASFLGIMLGFPKDSSLIYLFSQNSFYSSFIYLPWVLEYNPEQHILIGWLVIRILLIIVKNSLLSAQVFLGIFTFLSGVISYFVFSKLNLRYPLLLSLLYQFNIFNPVVNYSVSILPYAFLPLSLFLVYYNKKIMYAISTLVAAV